MDKRLMTPEQLAAIRARADAATDGPWNATTDPSHFDFDCVDSSEWSMYVERRCDRDFIAHARADIPALLDEVRRLQGQVEALASLVKEAYRQGGYREKNDPPKGRETYEDAFYYSEARLRLNAILNGAESEGANGN